MTPAVGMSFDVVATKHCWSQMRWQALNPMLSRRMISGGQLTVAQIFLKAGGEVPLHEHINEQVSYVLYGALRFWLGDKIGSSDMEDSMMVRTGESVLIPSLLPHRAVALVDTLTVDIFAPAREDWLSGQDSYLKDPDGSRPRR